MLRVCRRCYTLRGLCLVATLAEALLNATRRCSVTVFFLVQLMRACVCGLRGSYGNRYVQRSVDHISRKRVEAVQARFEVGPAGDKYEQEADSVAKQVVALTSSSSQEAAQCQAFEEEPQTKPLLQRQVDIEGGGIEPEIEKSIERIRGQGQYLPEKMRASMQGALGSDFSGRVHTDAESDVFNDSVSTRAITTGQDISFADGEYSPVSSGEKEVLAQELTHVRQQNCVHVERESMEPDPVGIGRSKEIPELYSPSSLGEAWVQMLLPMNKRVRRQPRVYRI